MDEGGPRGVEITQRRERFNSAPLLILPLRCSDCDTRGLIALIYAKLIKTSSAIAALIYYSASVRASCVCFCRVYSLVQARTRTPTRRLRRGGRQTVSEKREEVRARVQS